MLMITVPHSGERVPPEADWLAGIQPGVLLTDVDRFVHELYRPASDSLKLPMEVMEIHRYVLDLNRLPTDIDPSCVEGVQPSASAKDFVSPFHWTRTTQGATLMASPISLERHRELVALYYEPYHQRVHAMEEELNRLQGLPRFHIDAHSMPSVATSAHKDAGQSRPDVVVSDCSGRSCHPLYKDLVIRAYREQGFEVAYNWPYLGGRMTEAYGKPNEGRHSVQVELKRSLYMDELTREKHSGFERIAGRIRFALGLVVAGISDRAFRIALAGRGAR
jgi:N-formylglutamate amidohydrolase